LAVRHKVYIETSVIRYLAGRRSTDLIVAGHQETTRKWWRDRRGEFKPYCSQLVVREASKGDARVARWRLQLLRGLPVLQVDQAAEALAARLTRSGGIPREAPEDALHIAVATVHEMDYLLTWNCKHIANAEIRWNLSATCSAEGLVLPIICTPEELMGG
jgi:predicted nucleic acid-binding protein